MFVRRLLFDVQVGLDGVVIVMVGNKVDLSDKREVPLETATKVHVYNIMVKSPHI